jgi:hypothetical protein
VSKELAGLLDLHVAWRRVKLDIANRVFIGHPYSISLVESDLEDWLQSRLSSIAKDAYAPSPMFVCDVPKENGLIRPGSHLSYTDRLVYAACVGACFGAIHHTLKWSQGEIDFSYMLAIDAKNPDWTRDRFVGWKEFDQKSVAQIEAGAPYTVLTDIAAFYENIDIGFLISDLRAIGAPPEAVDQLSACLNKWAQIPNRGIPQGQTPSDILAKLYFNNIDKNLRNMGYVHLRYVDDIRVFCGSLVQAKQLLIDLSQLLRRRGLNLQSAKTDILPANDAKVKIESVTSALRAVRTQFIAEVVETSGAGDPYISLSEADDILEKSPDETPIEIIQKAYQDYFVADGNVFNKSLFRFLLRRLAKQEDTFAGDHSFALLELHPEETQTILSYLRSVFPMEYLEPPIIQLIRSGRIVYYYQLYQILDWFYQYCARPSEDLVDLFREICFDAKFPRYVRTTCRAFLANHGTNADLERIAAMYDYTADPSERVEIICSIRRLEKGRRNALFSRVESDGEMNRRAVKWVRSQ